MKEYTFEYDGKTTTAYHTDESAYHWAKEYVRVFKKPIRFYETGKEENARIIEKK